MQATTGPAPHLVLRLQHAVRAAQGSVDRAESAVLPAKLSEQLMQPRVAPPRPSAPTRVAADGRGGRAKQRHSTAAADQLTSEPYRAAEFGSEQTDMEDAIQDVRSGMISRPAESEAALAESPGAALRLLAAHWRDAAQCQSGILHPQPGLSRHLPNGKLPNTLSLPGGTCCPLINDYTPASFVLLWRRLRVVQNPHHTLQSSFGRLCLPASALEAALQKPANKPGSRPRAQQDQRCQQPLAGSDATEA